MSMSAKLAGRVVALVLGTLVLGSLASMASAAPTARVSGYVFEDRRETGGRDRGDRGVAGVTVSDGQAVVQTDAGGYYELEVDAERRHTDVVFIAVPSGFTVPTDEHMTPRFYRHVDLEPGGQAGADFALHRDRAQRVSSDYRALGLADVHVQAGTTNNRERFSHQIDQLNELVEGARRGPRARRLAPRFTVVAGDLTNNATLAEFADYQAATATSLVPVWPALGNHEYFFQAGPEYKGLVDHYRRHLGPEWYSFSYADQHFVVLENNSGAALDDSSQLDWLTQDLALNAQGKEVVVITHKPLNTPQTTAPSRVEEFVELLEGYDTTLLLAGHTHSNDVDQEVIAGAKHAVTNSASYTIDQTPNGFRVLDFAGDRDLPDIPFREFETLERDVTVVHPAPDARVAQEPTDLQVNAYHTSSEVVGARARMDGGGPWIDLAPHGARTWSAPWDAGALGVGAHEVTVELRDNTGHRWTETSGFQVVADGGAVVPEQGGDWAMFHGDAAHTGVAADEVSPELGLAWSHRSEGTILTSSPAVVDELVYVGVRDEDAAAGNSVLAVDLATGQERWRTSTNAQVQASPAVADGLVYTGSIRGTLYALDAATGAVVWELDVRSGPLGLAWMYQSPTVADGVVYQAYSSQAEGTPLVALDATSGNELWRTGSLGGSFLPHSFAAVGDDHVYVGAGGGTISAVDPDDGQVVWQASPAGGWMRSTPMYAHGKVLMNYQGDQLVALDADTGAVAWRYRSPGDSFLFGNGTASVPAVADGTAYVGFADGSVSAIDLESGSLQWTQRTGDGVISSPAVSGGYLYVGSNDGHLYGLDRATGQPLWDHEIGTWVASSPAVTGNTVVAGAWDGNLYAFTADGREPTERWPRFAIAGQVTDAADETAIAQARVEITDAGGERVAGTRTDADGQYAMDLAGPPGDYQVVMARRGYLPAEVTVTADQDGATIEADAALDEITEPVAGASSAPTDFNPTQPWTDSVVPGDEYHFVANDRIQATISSRTANNNQPGTFRAGWLSDLALTDEVGLETLDWTEYMLTTNGPGEGPDWGRSGEWLPLPDIEVAGYEVMASGRAEIDESLEATMTYRALPGAPVVKLTLELSNTGAEDFDGYFHYNIDPDSQQDVALVPGLGSNPGHVSEGWTANYVYDGPTQERDDHPAHGIAWLDDEPMTLSAHGYIFGAWFDAATPAGQSTELSWYHITDYPAGGGDVTANIAYWASRLAELDPS